MEELCDDCGHSKSAHPTCTFCSCNSFKTKGPISIKDINDLCIDCGHHKNIHNFDSGVLKCNHSDGLCQCQGFVSRSEALNAVRTLHESIPRSEVLDSLRKLEEEFRGG